MNIVNKLTLKQLLLNKKRTLVTIIGVIISVAMITAVASLGVSFMDMMKRQVISDDGQWHVLLLPMALPGSGMGIKARKRKRQQRGRRFPYSQSYHAPKYRNSKLGRHLPLDAQAGRQPRFAVF